MGGDADSLPGRSGGSVGVDRGDAEEGISLTDAEDLRRVGGSGGGLAHKHGTPELLHDVDELLGSAGSGAAGQDDQALLGTIPHAWGAMPGKC